MTHHISRTVYHMIMILRYMWAMNSTKWTILVYHASYLMNHTLFDCYLRYICVKWWSLGFFFILSNSVWCALYLIILLSFVVYKCKMMIPPGVFSIFSKFWFLRLLVGKRAKKAQNDKKFCLLCSISQEYHIIWLSLVLHKYKMMISPCVVFSIFFKILIFQLVSGIKGKKKQPKMTKNSVALHISGIKHIIIICGTQI